jgi:hypothetical protein
MFSDERIRELKIPVGEAAARLCVIAIAGCLHELKIEGIHVSVKAGSAMIDIDRVSDKAPSFLDRDFRRAFAAALYKRDLDPTLSKLIVKVMFYDGD